ncbi:ATP-binding cassette domain-containing protein [Candidatus Omnitrophota bacterium]
MISTLKLQQVYKQYGGAQFSLSIKSLEFHNKHIQVIVGPNGSGKSALLNLLAFIDIPDQGTILIDNKPMPWNNKSGVQLHKRIGFVRQTPYLFNTNVFENVALGLRIRRIPRSEVISKVCAMLETLNIQHLAKRRVNCLSRGEYQKVAIAQILVLDPEIILMDEPAANIDTQSTLSIEETVKNIQKNVNAIIIMTTHSSAQAYRMSPDIISIQDGRIVGFIHENVFFEQMKDATDIIVNERL